VDQMISRFGKIDVLAHIMGGFAAGAIGETDERTWTQMLDLNLISAFHALRAVISPMRKAQYGGLWRLEVWQRLNHMPGSGPM